MLMGGVTGKVGKHVFLALAIVDERVQSQGKIPCGHVGWLLASGVPYLNLSQSLYRVLYSLSGIAGRSRAAPEFPEDWSRLGADCALCVTEEIQNKEQPTVRSAELGNN